jgi:hypothetical protein
MKTITVCKCVVNNKKICIYVMDNLKKLNKYIRDDPTNGGELRLKNCENNLRTSE